MKTKDRIIQVRISAVPEITLWISKLDSATTRKEIYQLQDSIYNIPGIREMNHAGCVWETFSYTLSDMCTAKISELIKIEKAAKAAQRAKDKQEKEEADQRVVARANRYMELPALKDALDQVSVGFYDYIVRWVTNDLILKLRDIYDNDGKFILQQIGHSKADYARYQSLLQLSFRYREYSSITTLSNRRADWEEVVHNQAKKTAQDTIDGFKHKMALKLGAVIDKKGGAEIKVIGSTVDNNSLWFKFPDDSSFEIRTQQVISISVLGKMFARYPSTFHSVIDHEGQKMINPSATRLQIEFGGLESFWDRMEKLIKEEK